MKLQSGVILILFLITFVSSVKADPLVLYWGPGLGVIGLIIFIFDIIAIFEVLTAVGGFIEKLCWILLIIFFPVLGLIIYCLCGRPTFRRGYISEL